MRLRDLESSLSRVSSFSNPIVVLEQYSTPPSLAAHIIHLIQDRYGDITNKAVADLGTGCGVLAIAACFLGSAYTVGYDIDEQAIQTAQDNCRECEVNVDLVLADVTSLRGWQQQEQRENNKEGNTTDKRQDRHKQSHHLGRGKHKGRKGMNTTTRVVHERLKRNHQHPNQRRYTDTTNDDDEEENNEQQPQQQQEQQEQEQADAEDDQPLASPLPSSSLSVSASPSVLFDTVVMNPPFGTRSSGADVAFLLVGLRLTRHAVYSLHKSSTREFFIRQADEWQIHAEVIAEMQFTLPKSYKFHREKSVDVEVDLWRFSFINDRKPPWLCPPREKHTTPTQADPT